jgi:hypothetical protein
MRRTTAPVDAAGAAIVACGGAMGGLLGPGDALYQRLGDAWAGVGVTTLRVSYRRPNDLDACTVGHLLARSDAVIHERLGTWLPTVLGVASPAAVAPAPSDA